MDEQPNLREFLNEVSSLTGEAVPAATTVQPAPVLVDPIGQVVEIAGSGSQIRNQRRGFGEPAIAF